MSSSLSLNLSVKKPHHHHHHTNGSSSSSRKKRPFKISKTILSLVSGGSRNNSTVEEFSPPPKVLDGRGRSKMKVEDDNNNNKEQELPSHLVEKVSSSNKNKISNRGSQTSATNINRSSRKKKKHRHRESSIEWVTPHFVPAKSHRLHPDGTGDYLTSENERNNNSSLEPSAEVQQLEHENKTLQLQVFNLQKQFQELKTKSHRHVNRNVVLARMNLLQKENQNLKDDSEVLKSVIRRLNKEIRFYQDKIRSKYKSSLKIPVYSTSNSTNDDDEDNDLETDQIFLKEPKARLQPLLVAYDEIIAEKNELIKDYEVALESFRGKVQEIVRENDKLHKAVTESRDKGSVSESEWQVLYNNAMLVLEGNDLLRDQVSVLKRKAGVLQKRQEDKESKFLLKISLLEEERLKMKVVNSQLDNHCKSLQEQVAKLTESLQQRIPLESHEASVMECKRLFEELKTNYGEDRNKLTEKLAAVETEKHRLVVEVTDLGTENAKQQGTIKDLENSLASNHAQIKQMYAKMEETSQAKEATAKTVAEMMELAKAVVQDRESLEQSLVEQKNLNVKMMNIREQESELVNELRQKIKFMEEAHQAEVQKLVQKIRELEKILDGIGEMHEVDMAQLRELAQEKSQRIEMLIAEKSQLSADLETVWRATTTTTAATAINK